MHEEFYRRMRRRWLVGARHRRARFRQFTGRWARTIAVCATVLSWLTFVASVACLTLLILYVGFDHGHGNLVMIRHSLRAIQGIFLVAILFNYTVNLRATFENSRWMRYTVDALMLLTLMAVLYPHPEHPWLPWLERLIYSRRFLYGAMTAFSLLEVSATVSRLAGRRTNPSLLLAGSFLIIILIGSFVLMMPKCTYAGISYVDSLFVSTSAVCICGLTPVDIATTFTPLGQMMLVVMFEIGGLGIITFTSFFAIFFSGSQSVYNQLLVRDIVYSKTMNGLVPTLLYILSFTLILQAIGAIAIYLTLPAHIAATEIDRIWISVFHAVSGFCNVGFSNVQGGLSNPVLMGGPQAFYLVMSVLVAAGAIGFPVLTNIRAQMGLWFKRVWRRVNGLPRIPEPAHAIDLSTKIALTTTVIVFVFGATAFFVLENGNTLRGMPLTEQVTQSVFNAVMPRSGGFSSVSPSAFLNVTLLLVMLQMWIGGASQSMAGGIKVNTFGVIALNMRAIITQTKGVAAFRRRVATPSIRRANAVVTLSVITVVVFAVTLLTLEPALSSKWVFFETFSATFNVGSSLGATPFLGNGAKCVLCVAMFMGRVGLISLLSGMFRCHRDPSEHYIRESVIIS